MEVSGQLQDEATSVPEKGLTKRAVPTSSLDTAANRKNYSPCWPSNPYCLSSKMYAVTWGERGMRMDQNKVTKVCNMLHSLSTW